MRASALEYRFRFLLHALIFLVGFTSPWVRRSGIAAKSTWITLAATFAEHRWLNFMTAVDVLLVLAIIFTALGGWFRLWGSAYVGSSVVASRQMHGEHMLADGPYRRTRNPLYLGTLLHTIGISLLMTPSGALFTIAAIWVLQIRLALAEEPFLAARFGQPYLDYAARVPRFLPSLTPLVPSAGQKPQWLQSLAGEFYFVAVAVLLAGWGWQFNAQPLLRGLLISLGLWLVARAFLPKPANSQS